MGRSTSVLPATLKTEAVAELAGVDSDTIYTALKVGGLPPFGICPLRVGRRILWPTSRVLDAFGLDEHRAAELLGLADTAA
jgi:hypothetical protein